MNVADVDLNLLRVFDAVLREHGVTPAAARLGLSQPAVSNALARLRGLFGDALFVRTPAGMAPTPFARQLDEPVRQALALIESALTHGAAFEPATSNRAFRFYMSDLGEISFLPPLVERVRRLAPQVRLEASGLALDDIPDALAGGALDLAVGFLPGLAAPVRRKRLFRDAYVCLMRADHPRIKDRLTRRLFEEASHALVSSTGSGHRVIEEALERHGLTRRIALRVPHFTVVPMVLERTDLLLTLPSRVARVYEEGGRFKSLPPPVPIPFADVGVHWHERFDRDPGNRWLRELILELFAVKE
ncbi:MAG TPA: LysR family transcriptional regulator [Burkholderiales bacterium]|nr:LysR family transcriptional regulator [Burkholderiales bacterium]